MFLRLLFSTVLKYSIEPARGSACEVHSKFEMVSKNLCPKCKSDYLRPTEKPREMICRFCGATRFTLTLEELDKLDNS